MVSRNNFPNYNINLRKLSIRQQFDWFEYNLKAIKKFTTEKQRFRQSPIIENNITRTYMFNYYILCNTNYTDHISICLNKALKKL